MRRSLLTGNRFVAAGPLLLWSWTQKVFTSAAINRQDEERHLKWTRLMDVAGMLKLCAYRHGGGEDQLGWLSG